MASQQNTTSSPAPTDYRYDVFISYSSKDKEWVRGWLLPRLKGAGFKVCIDYESFDIGDSVPRLIEKAVALSRHILLVLTPNWVESEWTQFESFLALREDPSGIRRRTLPVKREECKIPDRISIFHYADLTGDVIDEAEFARLLNALRGIRNLEYISSGILSDSPTETATILSLPAHQDATAISKDIFSEWICQNCHIDNPPQAEFCLKCNTRLVRWCPECHYLTSLVATNMCSKCGYDYDVANRRKELRQQIKKIRQDCEPLTMKFNEINKVSEKFPVISAVWASLVFTMTLLLSCLSIFPGTDRTAIYLIFIFSIALWLGLPSFDAVYAYLQARKNIPILVEQLRPFKEKLQRLEAELKATDVST